MLLTKIFNFSKFSNRMCLFYRTVAFKVLQGEINYNDATLKNSQKKFLQADSALKTLSDLVKSGGGSKAVHRHTVLKQKLLVRHRLKLLFDPNTPFLEVGLLAGMFMDYGVIPAAGTVAGIGKIHGHFCLVGAQDATVKGGVFFPISIVKQIRLQQLAYLNKLPCIYLVDSGGAFLPLQADIFPDRDHGGRTFYNEAVLSSKGIPQIALVCGSSTAGGAYCPTMAEEAIIVKKSGVIFLAGPPLVKAATGEIVNEQDLGGADLHCSISGCTDYYAENEEEAFEMCRESVLCLNLPHCSKQNSYAEPLHSNEDLNYLSGKQLLSKEDMYLILARILDGSMFKEFKGKFGHHLITGFGFLHGMIVGILANSDALTYQDAQKGTHFIQLCDKRHIPLLFLQNSGCSQEIVKESDGNIFKDRSKMIAAHCSVTVPKIVLNISGCFGDDNFTMCGWSFEPNFLFSWPLAHVSFTRKLSDKAIAEEETVLNKLSNEGNVNEFEKLFENTSSAFSRASKMLSDGIISPGDTRQVLALCLEIATTKNSHNFTQNFKKCALAVLRM